MNNIEISSIALPKVDPVSSTGVGKNSPNPPEKTKPQQKKEATAKSPDMTELVLKVDQFVKSLSTKVSFSIDNRTGKRIIIVSETDSGQIVRQIPPKEMLELAAKMEEISGIIFNGQV